MKIIQIFDNKAHWVTPYKVWDEVPEYAPNIVLVECGDENVQEGWDYDAANDCFFPPAQREQPKSEMEVMCDKINELTKTVETLVGCLAADKHNVIKEMRAKHI